jgi:hypothetical protein
MYLVGHNFAYVGSLQDSTNDPTLANEGHQAERLNGAQIYYQSVDQSGNMRVGNVFKVEGATGKVLFTATTFQFNGSSLEFTSGSNRTYLDSFEVSTGYVRVSGNTLTTISGDLILGAANQELNLSSISELILPKGATTNPFNTVGGIRFNTTINDFEGYAASGTVGLYGILDSTKTTKITAELTPGVDDKTIRMYANNDLKVSITDSTTTIKNLYVGDLQFNQPTLNLVNNSSLTFAATSGITTIQNIALYTDTIENVSDNALIEFPQNGTGYIVFDGNAVQIPYGTDTEQPVITEIGMHRYNTTDELLEVWNGTEWVPATGAAAVSAEDMIEESNVWTFVLG